RPNKRKKNKTGGFGAPPVFLWSFWSSLEKRFERVAPLIAQLCANFLTQHVNRPCFAFVFEMPERPTVAGGKPLQGSADLVDRAFVVARMVACHKVSVCTDAGGIAAGVVKQNSTGLQKALFDNLTEGDARLGTFFDRL